MTLQEVIIKINKNLDKRDLFYERTPANRFLYEKHFDEFEAVMSGKGNEKYLIPNIGSIEYLYRGQNEVYNPCLPSIYRGKPSEIDIFIERLRLTSFSRLLDSHPVVKHFFKRHHFVVDYEGLAQHYGLKTSVLDLTSDLDTALFFATCKFDKEKDEYIPITDKKNNKAILYIFDPLYDNEPVPSSFHFGYMRENIRPIGLQAFKRPGAQKGFSLHIPKGESIKCWMYEFTFTPEESMNYFEKYQQGRDLWIKDELVEKTKPIMVQTEFSVDAYNETASNFLPKGYTKNKLKKNLIDKGIKISTKIKDPFFSMEECKEIIETWNNGDGEIFCKKIVRKPWFRHKGINEETGEIIGIYDRHEFESFEHKAESLLVKFIQNQEAGPLEGATWINYRNTPTRKKMKKNFEGWIPPGFSTLFGRNYFQSEDFLIPGNF